MSRPNSISVSKPLINAGCTLAEGQPRSPLPFHYILNIVSYRSIIRQIGSDSTFRRHCREASTQLLDEFCCKCIKCTERRSCTTTLSLELSPSTSILNQYRVLRFGMSAMVYALFSEFEARIHVTLSSWHA